MKKLSKENYTTDFNIPAPGGKKDQMKFCPVDGE
jgi:hypothetical protein